MFIHTTIASTDFFEYLIAQIFILLAVLKYIDLVLSTCDIKSWPQSYPQTHRINRQVEEKEEEKEEKEKDMIYLYTFQIKAAIICEEKQKRVTLK